MTQPVNQKPDIRSDLKENLREKAGALIGKESQRTTAGSRAADDQSSGVKNEKAVLAALETTVIPQQATSSLISEKLAMLRQGLKKVNTDDASAADTPIFVTQEDIELGRDTSVLDNFIEDVIANLI